jgi:glycogen debranching enzyme
LPDQGWLTDGDQKIPDFQACFESTGFSGELAAACRSAVQVLRQCSHPKGLKASAFSHGHREVWARDSMIALLGAALVNDDAIRAALLASLATLHQHQTPEGLIPNHVDTELNRPNFRAYADGGLWYVIGSSICSASFPSIRKAMRWYDYQDVDHSGLISIQEASDWQDLFCTRGKGLYVNCLRVIALRRAAHVAERRGIQPAAARWRKQAEAVSEAINGTLWYAGDGDLQRQVAPSWSTSHPQHDSLGRPRWLPSKQFLAGHEYYVPYASFRHVGEWFDSLGNLLSILAGVAGEQQSSRILDLISCYGLADAPIQAIYPPVQPGSSDWRPYYGALNVPGQYHNGGIWPFLGGFYVAALVKMGRYHEAEVVLQRLAQLNLEGEFNEWHDSATLEPKGVRGQAWSAGTMLYARACVAARKVLWL